MTRALVARGHNVTVACYHFGTEPSISGLRLSRCRPVRGYHRLAAGPSYAKLLVDWQLARTCRTLMREESFDLVHAHHYEGLLVALCAAGGRSVPIIYDAHTLLSSELPHYGLGLPRGVKRWLGASFDRHLPKLATHVIAVTHELRAQLQDNFALDSDRATVVGNGVEAPFFAVEFQEPVDHHLIFTGGLAKYQGIQTMLEAVAIARHQLPGLRLQIVTADDFAPWRSLAAQLELLPAIELLPDSLDLLPQRLAKAAVALNPRPACDGVPLKLLNYMAAARPIVSAVGSARLLEHQRSAWLAADNDVQAFAAGIVALITDRSLARRLAQSARAVAESQCSWHATALGVEQVYEQVRRRKAVT
jgi:glycosyltransferase involved in cell wall biosynthesis